MQGLYAENIGFGDTAFMMGSQMENKMEHDMASGFLELGGSRTWVSVFAVWGLYGARIHASGFWVGFLSASFGGGAVAKSWFFCGSSFQSRSVFSLPTSRLNDSDVIPVSSVRDICVCRLRVGIVAAVDFW